jgi:squalene cyclase
MSHKNNYLKIITLIACLFFLSVLVYRIFFNQKSVNDENIQAAIGGGVSFLEHIQNKNTGAICDTANPLFNVWETVLSAQALHKVSKDTSLESFRKAKQYLRKAENSNGLLCHNLKCRASYCVETSALYMLLLNEIGENQNIQKPLDTLAKLQQQTGEWLVGNPDVREVQNFPSATAFALAALKNGQCQKFSKDKEDNKVDNDVRNDREKALNWLLEKQRKRGDWGYAWEYYDLSAYAIWAVSYALLNLDEPKAEEMRQKALVFILETQAKKGFWNSGDSYKMKKPSKELETAMMLVALQNLHTRNNNKNGKNSTKNTKQEEEIAKSLEKGIHFLLNQQTTSGAWYGGHFPIESDSYQKQEYILATSLSIIALQQYFDSY